MLSPSRFFPPVADADEEGFLAWSEDLSVAALVDAYTHGIFPWPCDRAHILWFALPVRSVLFLDRLQLPRSLRRELKKAPWTFSVNADFDAVIRQCAAVKRRGEQGTWITPKMIRAYRELHRAGGAWSFEAWDAAGRLVGGLYGVLLGRFFAGESMFHLVDGASKFALVNALDFLRRERQVEWVDTQVPSPLFERLGACCIGRDEYLQRLERALGDLKNDGEEDILPA